MLCSQLHDFAYGGPRVFAAGGYPCCCEVPGSSRAGSSSGGIPQGSSMLALPGCEPCIGGWIAAQYQVEVAGILPGTTGCEACNTLNGVYVVEITGTSAEGCFGSLTLAGVCQDAHGGSCYRQLLLSFGLPTPSLGVPVRMTLGPRSDDTGAGECSSVATIIWQGHLSAPGQKLACLTLNHQPLAFHSRTGSLLYCDPFESQVWITAL